MQTLILILELACGALGLHFGATWLVSGSSRLAVSLGVKPLIIGLTLVAYGTGAPELAVSLTGALEGSGDLSIGNVIGSNIANIGLILGLCAIIKPIHIEPDVFKRDLPAMLFAALLIAVLPFVGGPVEVGDGVGFRLEPWKGAILLLTMVFVIWRILKGAKGDGAPREPATAGRKAALALITLLGLGTLLAGAMLFVEGSIALAHVVGVPELVIGLTVVAVGTSLPELATSLAATIRGETAISVGNIVGSNIFNICAVLGVVAMISPVTIDARVMQLDMIVMLAFTAGVAAMAWQGRSLSRIEGGVLLVAYTVYVLNLFLGWV